MYILCGCRFSGILTVDDLCEVDPERGKFLRELRELAARKQRIAQDNTLSLETKARQIQNLSLVSSDGSRLEDLMITFTYLPGSKVYGFSSVDLVSNGSDIEVSKQQVTFSVVYTPNKDGARYKLTHSCLNFH